MPMPIWVVRQPDGLDEMLDDRRPDRAGDVVAAGADADGDAAPAREPARDVGHHRSEHGRSCRAGRSAALGERELPDAAATVRPRVSRTASVTAPMTIGRKMP